MTPRQRAAIARLRDMAAGILPAKPSNEEFAAPVDLPPTLVDTPVDASPPESASTPSIDDVIGPTSTRKPTRRRRR
ncbi:MAG: hypothetical protein JSR99_09985 [Proteobacteria bacterium]|nr:hypothetical protein [Pseudomonadota bacterium]